MNTPLKFDVIVVYNPNLAHSAADTSYTESAPFAQASSYANCNISYYYFLHACQRAGLRAAFATTKDICGAGSFKAVWTIQKKWQRTLQLAHSHVVFDKFSPAAKKHQAKTAVLLSRPNQVTLFHNPVIRELFDDKLKTYQFFPNYAIPTVKIDLSSTKTIAIAQQSLQTLLNNHPHKLDFTNALIVKDRFGMGGNNIYKITDTSALLSLGQLKNAISFIIQPFINLSGFSFGHYSGNIDLRVIICNNAIVQSYIRIAQPGEFRANAQQGGKVVYLTKAMIPAEMRTMVSAILEKIEDKQAIYALDFIKSAAGNLYFIEGNTGPGINWFNPIDERRAKQLIRLMVKNIKTLVSQ